MKRPQVAGLAGLLLFVAVGHRLFAQERAELNLERAIEVALENNRQIKVVRFTPAIARAQLLAGRGAFDPALNLGRNFESVMTPFTVGAVGRSTEEETDGMQLALSGFAPWGLEYQIGTTYRGFRARNNPGEHTRHAGIKLSQPLLRGAGVSAPLHQVRLLKADVRISDWEFRQTVADTITRVAVGYSEAQFAHEFLRVTQRSRELATKLLRENESRVVAGGMAENQLIQARARIAAREEAVIAAEQGLRDADLRLRAIMGEDLCDAGGDLLRLNQGEALATVSPQAEDLLRSFAQRPDFQQARLRLEKWEAEVRYARAQLMPSLDLVGSYGYNGEARNAAESRRLVEERNFRAYSLGVVFSVPITRAQERGRLRAAKGTRAQAELDLERMKQEIALSIRLSAGRLQSLQRRITATRNAFALANEALDAELKKLRAGASTTFVVLSLQESLASAEVAMHRAVTEQRIAAALYLREIGGVLDAFSQLVQTDVLSPPAKL